MTERARLTKAQRELLSLLSTGSRDGFTDLRTVKVLERKRLVRRFDHPHGTAFAITDIGLATLKALEARDG